MINEATAVQRGRQGGTLDQGMADAAAQLRRLAVRHPTHEHAQMLSAIAALLDALLVDGETRH